MAEGRGTGYIDREMSKSRRQDKSGTKVKKRTSKKRKKSGAGGGGGATSSGGGGDSGGGGGVMMSLRGGFQKAGRAVTGTGEAKSKSKKQSKSGKILNYVLTIGLLAVLAYLVYTRFIQGG